MLLSADPTITDGVVCANQDVHFTYQMLGVQHVDQYLWSFGQQFCKLETRQRLIMFLHASFLSMLPV